MVRRDFALERMVSQTADLYRNLIAECRSQPIA
jgi:hypothetical protein